LASDPRKSRRLKANRKRGIGFEEVQEVFSRPYWLDQRSEVPEQFRMKKTRKTAKPMTAEATARLADQGKDVSRFFKGQGRMVQPIQRVNVDLSAAMLEELDTTARDLNVSRQAVIKTLVRQALDQHYLARRAKESSTRS
jgi:hypothetical protein